MATILQSSLLTNFLYPLLLVFFLSYAILQKTKILGDGKQQLDAGVSLIVSLIFVGAVFPKLIVANLVQFMSVGLVIIFVGLMLWGFISGKGEFPEKTVKKLGWVVGIAIVFAVLWATGMGSPVVLGLQKLMAFLFDSNWSGTFWTNAIFVVIVAAAIALVMKKAPVVEEKKGD
ncbi:hypothetical protein GW932_02020 [archaeon]|nr:hypothetical protein [archaeon]